MQLGGNACAKAKAHLIWMDAFVNCRNGFPREVQKSHASRVLGECVKIQARFIHRAQPSISLHHLCNWNLLNLTVLLLIPTNLVKIIAEV